MASCQNKPSAFNTSPEVYSFSLRVGAWNVRTLNNTDTDLSLQGKGDHLVGELERYGISLPRIVKPGGVGSKDFWSTSSLRAGKVKFIIIIIT